MLNYKCYGITLEDGSFLQDEYVVGVSKVDMSDPLDRQEHLAAISGSLESVVGREIESYSYMRIEDVA
jgi:hypothetical protein